METKTNKAIASTIKSASEVRAKLTKAKREVRRLERQLERAEKLEKEAKEAERAERIKALLEANKGKRVIIERSVYLSTEDKYESALAEEIKVFFNVNRCWVITIPNAKCGGAITSVKRIFVEEEI